MNEASGMNRVLQLIVDAGPDVLAANVPREELVASLQVLQAAIAEAE